MLTLYRIKKPEPKNAALKKTMYGKSLLFVFCPLIVKSERKTLPRDTKRQRRIILHPRVNPNPNPLSRRLPNRRTRLLLNPTVVHRLARSTRLHTLSKDDDAHKVLHKFTTTIKTFVLKSSKIAQSALILPTFQNHSKSGKS
jgi:hypothetical protein